jgi:hypothetical protein
LEVKGKRAIQRAGARRKSAEPKDTHGRGVAMAFMDILRRRKWAWAALLVALRFLPVSSGAARVTLAWDANSEPDLAGYKIYYGLSSGTYSFIVEAGNVTTHTISNLQEGLTYFFAATAYNTAGFESDLSPQVSYTVPLPSIIALGDGSFRVHFKGVPGVTYRIEYAESLAAPNWRNLGSARADQMGLFEITDHPPAGSPARFYRSVYP